MNSQPVARSASGRVLTAEERGEIVHRPVVTDPAEIARMCEEDSRFFEEWEPDDSDSEWRDATMLGRIYAARCERRSLCERVAELDAQVEQEVILARQVYSPWREIGSSLGTTAEAARQRYGPAAEEAGALARVPRRTKSLRPVESAPPAASSTPRYTARLVPVARGWEIHVDGAEVGHAGTLAQAQARARELIAAIPGHDPAAEIELQYELWGLSLDRSIAAATERAEAAARTQAEAEQALREVAMQLRALGLSLADIGVLLGRSRARVAQLLARPPSRDVTASATSIPC